MKENINWDQLDEDMQRGYSYLRNHETVLACNEWKKVWDTVVSIMDSGNYNTIEDIDRDFEGTQFISNWISDYEMELGNASIKEPSFAKTRIDFCTEYLEFAADKNELNSLNMRRVIAESYFRFGEAEQGEREFKKLTDEHPTWGWGWIGWSDEYGHNWGKENKNYDKAIEILTQALQVEGIGEKAEIKYRLKETYEHCGMLEEANLIIVEEKDYGVPLSELKNISNNAKFIANKILNVPVRNIKKIGRNEPCPCGSGKKYKRCCGK